MVLSCHESAALRRSWDTSHTHFSTKLSDQYVRVGRISVSLFEDALAMYPILKSTMLNLYLCFARSYLSLVGRHMLQDIEIPSVATFSGSRTTGQLSLRTRERTAISRIGPRPPASTIRSQGFGMPEIGAMNHLFSAFRFHLLLAHARMPFMPRDDDSMINVLFKPFPMRLSFLPSPLSTPSSHLS